MCGANQIKIWTEGPSIWRGRVGTWVPRQEETRGNLGSPPGGDAWEPGFPARRGRVLVRKRLQGTLRPSLCDAMEVPRKKIDELFL